MSNAEIERLSAIPNQRAGPAHRGNGTRQRSKRWCFTLNHPTSEEVLCLIALGDDGELCSYLVMGKETGDSGTPHIQGYVEFAERLGLRKAKSHVGSRAHLEVSRGTPEEAADYCKKDGNFSEYGRITHAAGQGRRTDLEAIKIQISNGVSEIEIADGHFSQWCQYRRAFTAYRSLLMVRRTWKSNVIVLWGKTGVGKTRRVHEEAPDVYVMCDPTAKWFDGYHGQEAVVFDDFAGLVEFRYLLLLLDRYPMQVPIKGGFVNWIPKTIYLTSNMEPTSWYPMMSEEDKAPLYRRLDKIEELK